MNSLRDWLRTFLVVASVAYAPAALAQMSCGDALQQLQTYANQVNTVANAEFYQGIPYKCGYNVQCRQTLFIGLNNWYMAQANQVNSWYAQLVQQCTSKPTSKKLRTKRQTEDDPGEIDVASIEDLTVDDEDKTVKIKIPSNPKGFK